MKKMRIGVIGCGNISDIYFKNLNGTFAVTTVQACSDIDMERAKASAERSKSYFNCMYDTVNSILSRVGHVEHKYLLNLCLFCLTTDQVFGFEKSFSSFMYPAIL